MCDGVDVIKVCSETGLREVIPESKGSDSSPSQNCFANVRQGPYVK